MNHILIIDDGRFYIEPYAHELAKGHRVTLCNSVQDGEYSLRRPERIDLLVLDIQMPTPSGVPLFRTRRGVDTGIWFLRNHGKELVEKGIPVFILTNRDLHEVSEGVEHVGFPRGKIRYYDKMHTPPKEFAADVTVALEAHRSRPRSTPAQV